MADAASVIRAREYRWSAAYLAVQSGVVCVDYDAGPAACNAVGVRYRTVNIGTGDTESGYRGSLDEVGRDEVILNRIVCV